MEANFNSELYLMSSKTHVEGLPSWFAKEVMGLELYDWQEQVLWDLALGDKPVFLKAANGSGKTQGVAMVAMLWHATAFPNSQVITTAGVYRQVKEQLWGNIGQYKDKLGLGWTINTTDFEAPNGSKGIGFSTDHANKFEGWHNDNLLIILDESKSIPDEIWQAVQRCNAPRIRILAMSSTGGIEGFFPEAFINKRQFFALHSVTSYDCPHLSDKWIQGQIDYWGRNHPLIRSMIFSEFVDNGSTTFVCSPLAYSNCLAQPPERKIGQRLAFIDWAAGGDENVMAIVEGNYVHPLICWRDKDTMAAANRAAIEILNRGIPKNRVFADDGGLGHPINDAMQNAGFPIRRVLNNMKPNQPNHFANLGAEIWFEGARVVDRKEIILPNDPVLQEQATTRRSVMTATNKLALEKKVDMKSRGLTSPDRADAVFAAITLANTIGDEYDSALELDFEMSDSQIDNENQTILEGCNTGL